MLSALIGQRYKMKTIINGMLQGVTHIQKNTVQVGAHVSRIELSVHTLH